MEHAAVTVQMPQYGLLKGETTRRDGRPIAEVSNVNLNLLEITEVFKLKQKLKKTVHKHIKYMIIWLGVCGMHKMSNDSWGQSFSWSLCSFALSLSSTRTDAHTFSALHIKKNYPDTWDQIYKSILHVAVAPNTHSCIMQKVKLNFGNCKLILSQPFYKFLAYSRPYSSLRICDMHSKCEH